MGFMSKLPLAWDDDIIDDPAAAPPSGWQSRDGRLQLRLTSPRTLPSSGATGTPVSRLPTGWVSAVPRSRRR